MIWLMLIPLYFIGGLLLVFFLLSRVPLPTESDLTTQKFPTFFVYYAAKYLLYVKTEPWRSGLKKYFLHNRRPNNPQSLSNSKEITLTAVGDIMYRPDLRGDKSRHLYEEIGDYLFGADISMGNLEFSINEQTRYEKTIRYAIPSSFITGLLGNGDQGSFNVLFLANNHLNDSLSEGIVATCNFLDEKGIIHVGANRTEEERDQFPIIERAGIKIALLAYSFSTNGIPLEETFSHGVNIVPFNVLKDQDYSDAVIRRQVRLARERGADIIIASNHWDVEFEFYPVKRIVERGHAMLEAGVDIILGHHPHIVKPAEWYETTDGRTALCVYSLGSITTYALKGAFKQVAEIASITLEKGVNDAGTVVTRIKKTELMPTYFLKSRGRILPLFETDTAIRKGNTPPYISFIDALQIKYASNLYKKYFLQNKAFDYK